MTPPRGAHDKWSEWLLERRFGGDAEAAEKGLQELTMLRNLILGFAKLTGDETLLDVGCGDGLIAFGALERLPRGRVIFADISRPLLDRCEEIARDSGVTERCEFIEASAEALDAVADESVDVVTTRSVLIYVEDKASAFREFYRVLRPGGRISLAEPINRFGYNRGGFFETLPAIADLAARLRAEFERMQPLDSHPMMNFDERDLFDLAETTGFRVIDVSAYLRSKPAEPLRWETLLATAGNPTIPTFGEVIRSILSGEEIARLEQHARPFIESGGQPQRMATATVVAWKDKAP